MVQNFRPYTLQKSANRTRAQGNSVRLGFDEKWSNDSRSSAWLLQLCSCDLGTGNNFFLRVLDAMLQGYCLVVTAIYILGNPMYVRGGGQCLMWSGCDL